MQTIRIGKRALQASRIGLGCVTFGREIDEAQSFRVLDYAFAQGINLLDTAEGYGGGQALAYRRNLGMEDGLAPNAEMHSSEKIIGRWLRATGLRKQVILQTKIARNFTRAHLAEALDASLERLQTDAVDIYMFHSYNTEAPLEEALTAMSEAVACGKVKVAGCSNFDSAALREVCALTRAQNLAPIETVQPVYNLVRREIEAELLPICRENGIAAVIYSPLGAGFLAGKYRLGESLPKGTRFEVIPGHTDLYFSPKNFELVEKLRNAAERTGLPMVRLALAWVFRKAGIDGVLIGARHEGHVDNAIAALENELPRELMAEMDQWSEAE